MPGGNGSDSSITSLILWGIFKIKIQQAHWFKMEKLVMITDMIYIDKQINSEPDPESMSEISVKHLNFVNVLKKPE